MNRRDFIKSTAIGLGAITVPLVTIGEVTANTSKGRLIDQGDIAKLLQEGVRAVFDKCLKDYPVDFDSIFGTS